MLQVISQKTGFFIVILVSMALFTNAAQSMGVFPAPPPQSSLLHNIDTFPTCAEVRRCWRTDSGRLRCGLVTRCQTCKWIKRCTRASGCGFVESCKWGPYKPPLKTN